MAQPLYFLPDLRKPTGDSIPLRRQLLKERGLEEIFADVAFAEQPFWELTGRGPDNRSGCIIYAQAADGSVPRRTGFYPEEQQWTPVGDGSLLWIGMDTAEPPKPEELARKKKYPGYEITLGDGNRWQVPIIRRPDGTTELPTDMVWDATGKMVEPIKPAYLKYWEETAETAAWIFDSAEPDYARALELAVRALSLNYRYGRNEHNILRVIDSDNIVAVLAATVDAPNQPQKKTVTNAPPGLPAGSPTTDQPAATCT